MIDALQGNAQNTSDGIAYMFYNYKERGSQTPTNVVATLCQQLLQQNSDALDQAKTLYDEHKSKRTRPSLDEYSQLLSEIAENFSKITLVLDAFDESPEDSEARERLLAKLQDIKTPCAILIFSRPANALENELPDAFRLNIESREQDIASYLDARLSRYQRMQKHFKADPELRKLMVYSIVPKAQKM